RRRQPVVDTAVTAADDWDARLADTPELVNPAAAMVAGYQRARDHQALRLALAQLEPAERTLGVLYDFEGCAYAQIREMVVPSLGYLESHRCRHVDGSRPVGGA